MGHLPQLEGRTFLTEAGLETDLIFNHDIDLPDFASFPLVDTDDGRALLTRYYQEFVDVARAHGTGAVFETPTWRANPDWGARLGYAADDLDRVNRDAVGLLHDVADANPDVEVVVSGNLGPRGDGYQVGTAMSADEAAAYHAPQIRSLAAAGADLVGMLTATYVEEAVGVVRAAREAGIPVAVAFTVETDGRLPSGEALADAVRRVDEATDGHALYFGINCAHPTHFLDVLAGDGPWDRVRWVRSNASKMSHEELDEATELDRGNEREFADGYRSIHEALPELAVVGGCCGTDLAHLEAVADVLLPVPA